MKLLFDQNLSYKLCQLLADVFPESSQVRLFGMDEADDRDIWEHAKSNGFIVVLQDADFADLGTLYGPPPKVIWLRCGNQPTNAIEKRLREHATAIIAFEQDDTAACWEIYKSSTAQIETLAMTALVLTHSTQTHPSTV